MADMISAFFGSPILVRALVVGVLVSLCAALLGFLAWLHLLSPFVLPAFEKTHRFLAAALALCKKSLKNFLHFTKFFFQKLH